MPVLRIRRASGIRPDPLLRGLTYLKLAPGSVDDALVGSSRATLPLSIEAKSGRLSTRFTGYSGGTVDTAPGTGQSPRGTVLVHHLSTLVPSNGGYPNPGYSHVLAATSSGGTTGNGWLLMLNNGTGYLGFRIYNADNGSSVAEADGAVALNDGKPHLTLATWNTALGQALNTYVDGVPHASATLSQNVTIAQPMRLGRSRETSEFWGKFDGSMFMAAVWDRVLSADEIRRVSSDPDLLPRLVATRTVPYSATSPNSYTLTTEPGNFALSGSATSIRASRKLAGGNGSFTLTGNTATLRAGRKVAGVTGVITFSGGAVGLVALRKVAAAPGAFALAGATASIRATRTIPASAGAFAVAGLGAALRASRRLTGAPAVFALAGSDARLAVARRLVAAAGAFTLTGGAAQLVYSPVVEGNVLFTETGQFVLTGSAVGMRVTRRLQAAPGSFALAGAAATIRCARGLATGPGAFVVAGGAAVLRATRRLSLALGSFDLVGNPAALAYSSTIEYARAPAGSGYTPRRNEYQARPAEVGGVRPAAIEKAYR